MLKSIAENDYPFSEYEILLVNNNSTDDTEEECRRFAADYPDVTFRYVVETNQGLSYARNRGLVEASGDILIYVDDDATVCTAYLREYARFFKQNPQAMGAGGPVFPVYESESPRWMSYFTLNLITGYLYLGKAEKEFPKGKFPIGANSAFRKEVFDRITPFDVELGRKGDSLIGAEEKDVYDRMRTAGMKIFYLPKAMLYHYISDTKLTKSYFDRLTYSIGVSERMRTLRISKMKYLKRLVLEAVKWGVSLILCVGYTLLLTPRKGFKLLSFRCNVTRGLLGR